MAREAVHGYDWIFGAGKKRRMLQALFRLDPSMEGVTSGELSRLAEMDPGRTALEHLHRLESLGLVERESNRWRPVHGTAVVESLRALFSSIEKAEADKMAATVNSK